MDQVLELADDLVLGVVEGEGDKDKDKDKDIEGDKQA
jgi:hypothetical protein